MNFIYPIIFILSIIIVILIIVKLSIDKKNSLQTNQQNNQQTNQQNNQQTRQNNPQTRQNNPQNNQQTRLNGEGNSCSTQSDCNAGLTCAAMTTNGTIDPSNTIPHSLDLTTNTVSQADIDTGRSTDNISEYKCYRLCKDNPPSNSDFLIRKDESCGTTRAILADTNQVVGALGNDCENTSCVCEPGCNSMFGLEGAAVSFSNLFAICGWEGEGGHSTYGPQPSTTQEPIPDLSCSHWADSGIDNPYDISFTEYI